MSRNAKCNPSMFDLAAEILECSINRKIVIKESAAIANSRSDVSSRLETSGVPELFR